MCIMATGCATPPEGPAFLTIESARYREAFDAAMAASRANDMSPTLRDRRLGVIDTEPSIEGSVIEPWRSGNDSLSVAWENTLVFQRRRARFEFTPASFREAQGSGVPDLLGVAGSPWLNGPGAKPLQQRDMIRVPAIVSQRYTSQWWSCPTSANSSLTWQWPRSLVRAHVHATARLSTAPSATTMSTRCFIQWL